MGRKPAEIRDDFTLAGRALSDAVTALSRSGWLPAVGLGAAALAAILTARRRRRPIAQVGQDAQRVVDRALQAAALLAAIERYRERWRRAA